MHMAARFVYQRFIVYFCGVETEIYRISKGRYVRGCMVRLLGRWGVAAALPLLACLVAGATDWRWLVVALAAVCVLLPGAVMLAFYYYALSPEAVRAIMPQRASLTDAGLELRYYPMDYKQPETTGWRPEPRMITRSDVARCSEMGAYTLIELKNGEIIEIPCSAQPRGMNLNEFFNHLS